MDHSSEDGVNFDILQGKNFPNELNGISVPSINRKDIDMGMMACKRKQFMFIFSGKMDEESELSVLDCEVDKEYNSDKMR